MDKLWAPWRMDYIRAPKGESDQCIFCEKSKSENDIEDLIIHKDENSFVIMNLYPYNNGHLLVAPYAHVSQFEELDQQTKLEMMDISTDFMSIMRDNMKAEGFNFGANFGIAAGAGIAEHLHLHIVPRWTGDTNFMPILGHTKVMLDGLKESRQFLADAFTEFRSNKLN
ncbi:MAG: HIT domain-containing protein [Candidatus Marinimicrobia bacterium]|nr:HIT domain-containing protein [Candidatus Neomarinimicrobiota bacterium]MBT3633716.1 HIT domain-containing protein [Candidatus Neomarinimicrobiota bacterium]MBT3682508.1 HIT domain-containing protein [Candidatus Neomarinimicrobiota bacterium]MBT3759272.1 HIT domain-containing protein [Candidatus Neomarinimicrobiota bacterium]MBT3894720.1 HIT domain-containing protein [Candidatus Neomarinimicrobiota bacterium]